ncbi:MAG: hypothetical protein R2711_03600 [Acidimicrobiales bacterium]
MAADILLYADEAPVGDDQRQHVELTRDLAERFNARYGATFTVPTATFPTSAARPRTSRTSPPRCPVPGLDGRHRCCCRSDEPKAIERKIKRAVTDNDGEVRFDVAAKPGVSSPPVHPRGLHRSPSRGRGVARLRAVRPAQGRHGRGRGGAAGSGSRRPRARSGPGRDAPPAGHRRRQGLRAAAATLARACEWRFGLSVGLTALSRRRRP